MNDTDREKITQVQAKYGDELLDKANVIGVAIGMKKVDGEVTDEPALVVMVSEKVPEDELDPDDIIPQEIDDVVTDVQEMGLFTAQ